MNNDLCQEVIWQLPLNKLILEEGKVHIWRANLNLSSIEIKRLRKLLSSDEIDRADRFRFPLHRTRFIAARGILRQLLGSYLEVSPNSLTFEYGDRGKPLLAMPTSNNLINFNLSHSQEYAIYGFTYHQPIGVDLEYVKEMPDALQIAQRFFSENEYQLIRNTVEQKQNQVFFRLWTAKEAYLKAIGTGLAGSLTSVDIGLNQAHPCLLSIKGERTSVTEWSLYSCIPQQDYIAAIALRTIIPFEQISFWHTEPDLLSNLSNYPIKN